MESDTAADASKAPTVPTAAWYCALHAAEFVLQLQQQLPSLQSAAPLPPSSLFSHSKREVRLHIHCLVAHHMADTLPTDWLCWLAAAGCSGRCTQAAGADGLAGVATPWRHVMKILRSSELALRGACGLVLPVLHVCCGAGCQLRRCVAWLYLPTLQSGWLSYGIIPCVSRVYTSSRVYTQCPPSSLPVAFSCIEPLTSATQLSGQGRNHRALVLAQ